jgi:multidrug efflux pump subunit AcrA (membrane-fusion protein)
LEIAGDAVNGVSVPRPAVIRFAGATWVYVRREGTNFVRSAVTLERSLTNGWLVSRGIDAGDQVVVSGAQTILSEELNRSGFLSGERD